MSSTNYNLKYSERCGFKTKVLVKSGIIYFHITATNKSGTLARVLDKMQNPELTNAIYRGGTFDGLMKLMSENGDTCLGVFDEFNIFLDNIDRGTTGNFEKGMYICHALSDV